MDIDIILPMPLTSTVIYTDLIKQRSIRLGVKLDQSAI